MRSLLEHIAEVEHALANPIQGDELDIILENDLCWSATVLHSSPGKIVLAADIVGWKLLERAGMIEDANAAVGIDVNDSASPISGSTQPDIDMEEAKYHGKEVPLNKPMRGDVKKSKVYVKDPKTGNIKKVNFGDPNMRIKKSSPKHRKSFRARHHCENPGPKTKARYWSCRAW